MHESSLDLYGGAYSLAELRELVPSLSSVAGFRPYRLVEGTGRDVLVVDVHTGSGFEFSVIPDRGMNIAMARYRGIPLDWSSGTGVVAPAYYDASGWQWLRSFHGGLVHTCGLDNVGVPVADPQAPGDNKVFGGHGRISSTPAREVAWRTSQTDGGLLLEVSGKVFSVSALEESLLLERTVATEMGSSRLMIRDRITNLGHGSASVFLLYHCNFGFPLLSPESVLSIPAASTLDSEGRPVENPDEILSPQEDTREQVLYPTVTGDPITVTLRNPRLERNGLGVYVRYQRRQLPYLTVWKQFAKRGYVLGIEPGTCRVEGRVAEKEKGRAVELACDQSIGVELELGVIAD
jgi:hypothetical protein